jgi:hypothetical protein
MECKASVMIALGILMMLSVAAGCSKDSVCPSGDISACFSVQPCVNMTDTGQKDECYFRVAAATRDQGVCEGIVANGEFYTQMEKLNCFGQMAVALKNASLCFRYTRYDSSAVCIRNVATGMNDSSICELDTMEKQMCYDSFRR